MTTITFDYEGAELAQKTFGFLTNKRTKKILDYLMGQSEAKCATDIYCDLMMAQSEVSDILGQLIKLWLVDMYKEGKFHYYKIVPHRVETFNTNLLTTKFVLGL